VDDADLEVEIQRELEEEEEALRSAWKSRQREQSSLLQAAVSRRIAGRVYCTAFKRPKTLKLFWRFSLFSVVLSTHGVRRKLKFVEI